MTTAERALGEGFGLISCVAVATAQATAIGAEFQINTYTLERPEQPAVRSTLTADSGRSRRLDAPRLRSGAPAHHRRYRGRLLALRRGDDHSVSRRAGALLDGFTPHRLALPVMPQPLRSLGTPCRLALLFLSITTAVSGRVRRQDAPSRPRPRHRRHRSARGRPAHLGGPAAQLHEAAQRRRLRPAAQPEAAALAGDLDHDRHRQEPRGARHRPLRRGRRRHRRAAAGDLRHAQGEGALEHRLREGQEGRGGGLVGDLAARRDQRVDGERSHRLPLPVRGGRDRRTRPARSTPIRPSCRRRSRARCAARSTSASRSCAASST